MTDATLPVEPVRIVCATREEGQKDFIAKTALGRSLVPWAEDPRLQVMIFYGNRRPLGEVYNQAIERARDNPAHLVFVHDDVQLLDFEWPDMIVEGLQYWQVLGVAGNRRRVPGQPAWAFVDAQLTPDSAVHLSGVVGHGREGVVCRISRYGRSGQRCLLLDGLLLAARSQVLNEHGLRFDPQFAFHFYDLDFCRQAEARGVSMGTWPLQVVHGSGGDYENEAWLAA